MASVGSRPQAEIVVDHYGPNGRSRWREVDWRTHQRWVRIEGRWMNVIDVGPQQPESTIVWIHGLSGSWTNWLENLPEFARRHRCIAMDLPGFGHSEMPAEPISIGGYARQVDALLRELGVERASIVGNSMGGFIGAEIAIHFGTWVDRLVLVSAAGISTENAWSNRQIKVFRQAEFATAAATGWLASKSDALARRPRSRRAMLAVVVAHPHRLPGPMAAEMLRGSGKPGFLDALEALSTYPLRDRLPRIQAPTLVVWGDRDRLVPVRDAAVFGEAIEHAEVVVYRDTGHMAMLERPDAFNELVAEFVGVAAG